MIATWHHFLVSRYHINLQKIDPSKLPPFGPSNFPRGPGPWPCRPWPHHHPSSRRRLRETPRHVGIASHVPCSTPYQTPRYQWVEPLAAFDWFFFFTGMEMKFGEIISQNVEQCSNCSMAPPSPILSLSLWSGTEIAISIDAKPPSARKCRAWPRCDTSLGCDYLACPAPFSHHPGRERPQVQI